MAGEATNLGGQLNALAQSFQTAGQGVGIQGLQQALIDSTSRIGEPDFDPLDPASIKKRIAWLTSRRRFGEAQQLANQFRQMEAQEQVRDLRKAQLDAIAQEQLAVKGQQSINAMASQWLRAKEAGDTVRMSNIEDSMRQVAVATGQQEDIVGAYINAVEDREKADELRKIQLETARFRIEEAKQAKEKDELGGAYYDALTNGNSRQAEKLRELALSKGYGRVVGQADQLHLQLKNQQNALDAATSRKADLRNTPYLTSNFPEQIVTQYNQLAATEAGPLAANKLLDDYLRASTNTQRNALSDLPSESEIDMHMSAIRVVTGGKYGFFDGYKDSELKDQVAPIAHNLFRQQRSPTYTLQDAARDALAIYDSQQGKPKADNKTETNEEEVDAPEYPQLTRELLQTASPGEIYNTKGGLYIIDETGTPVPYSGE